MKAGMICVYWCISVYAACLTHIYNLNLGELASCCMCEMKVRAFFRLQNFNIIGFLLHLKMKCSN
jgi:hypothetical protein